MALDAALFDLDGTLWDSAPWYAQWIGRAADVDPHDIEAGLKSGGNLIGLLRQHKVGRAGFVRTLRDSGSSPLLYPGVLDTLDQLATRGVPLGVVTNLPRDIATELLDLTSLRELFSSFVPYRRPGKPSPDPIIKAARLLGFEPSIRIGYVGDTRSDHLAAHRAGISFVYASYGYGEPDPALPCLEISQLDELLTL